MNDDLAERFSAYARETLRPGVDLLAARKRAAVRVAAGVFLAVLAVALAAVGAAFAPYRAALGGRTFAYWIVLGLVPLSLAVTGFSVAYVLGLHRAEKEFRDTLIGRIGYFIDPGLSHRAGRPFAAAELNQGLVLDDLIDPASGPDRFEGRAGTAAAAFADIAAGPDKNAGSGPPRAGLYFTAVFPRRFAFPLLALPASASPDLPGIGRRLNPDGAGADGLAGVEEPAEGRRIFLPARAADRASGLLSGVIGARLRELREKRGFETRLSCLDGTLRIAMLAPRREPGAANLWERFDMEEIRDFCRCARLCLDVARSLDARPGIWE